MYPWAVNFKGPEGLGIVGFIEMMTFLLFLIIGFYYIMKRGALKWEE